MNRLCLGKGLCLSAKLTYLPLLNISSSCMDDTVQFFEDAMYWQFAAGIFGECDKCQCDQKKAS